MVSTLDNLFEPAFEMRQRALDQRRAMAGLPAALEAVGLGRAEQLREFDLVFAQHADRVMGRPAGNPARCRIRAGSTTAPAAASAKPQRRS